MKEKYLLDMGIIVLKLLSKNPMHGYKIACEIEKEFGKRPSNGVLNPLFNKLESEGLIESYETVEHGKYKKIYSLSEKGRQLLKKRIELIKRFIYL